MINNVHLYKSFYTLGNTLNRCFGCSYCRADGNIINVNTLPSTINPLFRKIPVAVNLFYGDPMLQIDNTNSIIRRLEKDRHEGIVTVITKGDLSKFDRREYDVDLHVALSTFGTDSEYEPIKFDSFMRNVDLLVELREKFDIKVSLEFRPIIYNVNDSYDIIERMFKLAQQAFLCIAFSGLQVPKNLRDKYGEDLPFKPYPNTKFGYKKYLSKEIEDLFYSFSLDYGVPVFKKTSCCLSYLRSIRDYNAHYYRRITNRCSECPNNKTCFNYYSSKDKQIPELPFDYDTVYKTDHVCGLKKSGECEFPDIECSNIKGDLIKPRTITNMTTSDVRLIKWLTGLTADVSFYESHYISDFWKI